MNATDHELHPSDAMALLEGIHVELLGQYRTALENVRTRTVALETARRECGLIELRLQAIAKALDALRRSKEEAPHAR